MGEENPLWMLSLLSRSGIDPDSYSKAQAANGSAIAKIESVKGNKLSPEEYARLQAFASSKLNNDISANLGFVASQANNGDYKLQQASPRAGVNFGGLLDAGVSADVNRFAGYGMSDVSPSMRYDARANVPLAGGLLSAGGEYSTDSGPTYTADYGREIGGGQLTASVSRTPKYDETMALLNWMKRF